MSVKNMLFSLAITLCAITYLTIAYNKGLQTIKYQKNVQKEILRQELNAIVAQSDSIKAGGAQVTASDPEQDGTLVITTYCNR